MAERAETEKYHDAPRILVLVGDVGVQDKAPEGISGLVDSAQGLDEKW
jgi:hypothetical protein